MIIKSDGTGEFQQPPAGTFNAVCVRLIDLGTQESEYQGAKNYKHQMLLTWEIDELMGDKQPFIVSKFYTVSLSEKSNLYADLISWRGREFTQEELNGFDSKNLIGAPCMLSLVLSDKGRIKVATISRLPKGMPAMKPHNPTMYFTLEPFKFSKEQYESISDGIKRIIARSPEFASRMDELNGYQRQQAPQQQNSQRTVSGALDQAIHNEPKAPANLNQEHNWDDFENEIPF